MAVRTKLVIAASEVAPELNVLADSILSANAELSESIDGSEVAVDVCEFEVNADSTIDVGRLMALDADKLFGNGGEVLWAGVKGAKVLAKLPYGTQMLSYEGDTLIGRWYIDSVVRTGKTFYQINGMSMLGLYDNVYHAGGVYNGITVEDLLEEINNDLIDYEVDSTIADWTVYGWLPYDTARNNIHRLLMAMGINIVKGTNGIPKYTLLSDEVSLVIPDDTVYIGGKVSYGSPASLVTVTEHQFYQVSSVAEQTLFDNSDGSGAANNTTVVFNAPMFALSATTGLTIVESGANYAVLTGTGVLTGKPYTHTQKLVSQSSGLSLPKPKEVTVPNVGLINPLNSANVAARLASFYSSAQKVSGKMILNQARPGDTVTLTDAFGEVETGIITRMNVISSATVAASFEMITGYVPGRQGNNFEHMEVFTGWTGTWNVPGNIGLLRVILVGGGSGGQSGGNGEDGRNGSATLKRAAGGAGGKPGKGGKGGKIYAFDLYKRTGGITGALHWVNGFGGAGGVSEPKVIDGVSNPSTEPVDGSPGTATTVTFDGVTYSSDMGRESDAGVLAIMSGVVYGLPGGIGLQGGTGSGANVGNTITFDGSSYYPGADGTDHIVDGVMWRKAGAGGGAAVGNNGGDAPLLPAIVPRPDGSYVLDGGNGGAGADAVARAAASVYGQGGEGGHGGGGGGGGAGGNPASSGGGLGDTNGVGGACGRGGNGGEGANGCVIIYY